MEPSTFLGDDVESEEQVEPCMVSSLGDGLDTLPVEIWYKIGAFLCKDDLLSFMGANRALRALFAALLFRTIRIVRRPSIDYYPRDQKIIQELTLPTVSRVVRSVQIAPNAAYLEPDGIVPLIGILPSLNNLKVLTIETLAPFTEGLYLEIRRHPSLSELRISEKAKGSMWKPLIYVKDPPTCRLVYLEAPKVVVEDLLRKGSATAETIQGIAVIGQPMLRIIHQLGPFPSLRRMLLVERATGTFHESFWRFLHAHPDLNELAVTYSEDLEHYRDKTDLKKSVELRNNLQSISDPYFLLEPLIAATQGSLESVVISDVSYRGASWHITSQTPIETQLRQVVRTSFQLAHIQHLSIILHSLLYDLVISEFEALSPSQTLRELRSFGLVIKTNSGERTFEIIMDSICSALIGNLSPECKIMLSITSHEVHTKADNHRWINDYERGGSVLRAGDGPASCFHELCPTVMKWASMPSSFGLHQVEILWDSRRWFTFKRKVPGVEWLAVLTPNGGYILPEISDAEINGEIRLLPPFKNVVTVWIGRENQFSVEEFYPA
ncbi:hypothetical protein FRC18_003893 [Serendipita sp. 400]|nr:hypothetical protein FRC18_003893 [Serendipita sp. 400]